MSRHMAKRILSFILVLLLLTTAGCGSQQQREVDDGDRSSSVQEQGPVSETVDSAERMVYVPEYMELELGPEEDLYLAKFFGSSLYYVSRQYGDAPEDSRRYVCEYSLTEQKEVRRILVGEGRGHIPDYRVLDDGSIYVLNEDKDIYWLLVYDAQGEEQLAVNLQEEFGMRVAYIAPAVDVQGRIYLPHYDGKIVLLDAEGAKYGEVPLQGRAIYTIGMGGDGKIYISSPSTGIGEDCLFEILYEEQALGESYENYPVDRLGILVAARDGGFLVNTGGREIVYRYDLETQTPIALFSWMDCDISGESVMAMGPETEDGIWAVIYEGATEGHELVCLKQRAASSLPEKTELVIGTLFASQELKEAVAGFNRHSTDCRVTVREYCAQYAWTWESGYTDAITAMNIDLVSGNSPDLLDLTNLNVEAYARNDVFEDLGPWLDESEALQREDFVQNILDNYTYNGKLVSIPASVTLRTLTGKAAQVGEEPGWTLEEMIACAKAYPEAELEIGTYSQDVLRLCMWLGKSTFIDWTEGNCNFDSDAFRQLLIFAASYPDEPSGGTVDLYDAVRNDSDKVLLFDFSIRAFQDIQVYEAMYREEMTFIGYPTPDGEGSGCCFNTFSAYAITSPSENKEKAWEFLEYMLNRDVENGLSTNRKKLLETATAVEYLKGDWGQLFLDLDGRPILRYGTTNFGGWRYTYHEVTEEEKATLLYLMDTAQCTNTMDDALWRIIFEEASPFFQGQRTVEDAAAVIQSRVNLYLKENQ